MSMAKNKPSKQKKLSSYMKAPMKALIKARDYYVKSMLQLNDRAGFENAFMGCPTVPNINALPRSFSAGSAVPNKNSSSGGGGDDYRELVRAASARTLRESDYLVQPHRKPDQITTNINTTNNANKVPRSCSVGIMTIDEDKPCDFGDDFKVFKADQEVLPRSWSAYATSKPSAGLIK